MNRWVSGARDLGTSSGVRVGRTKRGLMRRIKSFSHCLHFVVTVLAKTGTPQL